MAGLSLAVLGVACATQGRPDIIPPRATAGVDVTIHDNRTHIELHVGDHLILSLTPTGTAGVSPEPVMPRWSLTAYPRDLLRLVSSDAAKGSFDLLATSTGTGVLRAVGRTCGPPLPDQVGGPPCPVAGVVGAPIVPIRLFTLTVTVD